MFLFPRSKRVVPRIVLSASVVARGVLWLNLDQRFPLVERFGRMAGRHGDGGRPRRLTARVRTAEGTGRNATATRLHETDKPPPAWPIYRSNSDSGLKR
jgi:hypothetical protein